MRLMMTLPALRNAPLPRSPQPADRPVEPRPVAVSSQFFCPQLEEAPSGKSPALRFGAAGKASEAPGEYGAFLQGRDVVARVWSTRPLELVKVQRLSPTERAERRKELEKAWSLFNSLQGKPLPALKNALLTHWATPTRPAQQWMQAVLRPMPPDMLPAHLAYLLRTARAGRELPVLPYVPLEDQVTILGEAIQPESVQPGAGGADYRFRVPAWDPEGPRYLYRFVGVQGPNAFKPDIYSRWQPQGPYGPSEVPVDQHVWSMKDWAWRKNAKTPYGAKDSVYEVHLGTFTKAGTLQAFAKRLQDIKEKGFTAVQLMPLHQNPGDVGWGYNPTQFFAVHEAYGKPADLKRAIDLAHQKGLKVIVDVVYNHIAFEGSHFNDFAPRYVAAQNEYGPRFNWQHPPARRYVLDNVRFWLEDMHADGLRLDATHLMKPYEDMMQAIAQQARAINPHVLLIAENDKRSNHVVMPPSVGGLGMNQLTNLEAGWHLRALAMGRPVKNLTSSPLHVAKTLEYGFSTDPGNKMFSHANGQLTLENHDDPKGSSHPGTRLLQFLYLQQREQGQDHATAYTLARRKYAFSYALPFLTPQSPLVFAGNEWGAKTSFPFFTVPLDPDVFRGTIRGVTQLDEERQWQDPTHPKTFESSQLKRENPDRQLVALTRTLNRLRREIPALAEGNGELRTDANGSNERSQSPSWLWDSRKDMAVHPPIPGSSVMAMRRWLGPADQPRDEVVILMNPSNQAQSIRLPGKSPRYREVFNLDDKAFGGSGEGSGPVSLGEAVPLSPWGMAIFRKA